jgi:hypothetical protein
VERERKLIALIIGTIFEEGLRERCLGKDVVELGKHRKTLENGVDFESS